VLSENSLQIVVLDDKKEEKEKEKIIKEELVKGEIVKEEEREYTVTPTRFIVSIDLIAHQADFILLEY
jgi:aspartate/glutamate racemase